MQDILTTLTMMHPMGITTIRITTMVAVLTVLTILVLITVQQTGKAMAGRTPTTIGLDTTEFSMRAVLITMPLQANILAPRTRIPTMRGVLEVLEVLRVMLALRGLAVWGEMLESLDQVDLQHPHNRRAAQVNAVGRVEEAVSLWLPTTHR
jgi:hypothetical protein